MTTGHYKKQYKKEGGSLKTKTGNSTTTHIDLRNVEELLSSQRWDICKKEDDGIIACRGFVYLMVYCRDNGTLMKINDDHGNMKTISDIKTLLYAIEHPEFLFE